MENNKNYNSIKNIYIYIYITKLAGLLLPFVMCHKWIKSQKIIIFLIEKRTCKVKISFNDKIFDPVFLFNVKL